MQFECVSLWILMLALGLGGCQRQRPAPSASTHVTSSSGWAGSGNATPATSSRAATTPPGVRNSTASDAAVADKPEIDAAVPMSTSVSPNPSAAASAATHAAAPSHVRAKIVEKVQRMARPLSGKGLLRYPEVTAMTPEASWVINDSITRLRTSYYDPTDPADAESPLVSMRFTVNHNGHGILSLTFETEWNGAYPSGGIAHRCYWLPTGEELVATRQMDERKLDSLVAALDARLKDEIASTRKKHQADPDWENVKDSFDVHFSRDNLKTFRVGSGGITFYFEYALAHAWKSMEPPGKFYLSFVELEAYLLEDGPLAGVLRAAKSRTTELGRK